MLHMRYKLLPEELITPYVDSGCDKTEAEKTMGKIQRMTAASVNNSEFTARAAFLALLGSSQVKRKEPLSPISDSSPLKGCFYPRLPSASDSDLEYFFHITDYGQSHPDSTPRILTRAVRLKGGCIAFAKEGMKLRSGMSFQD
jgi:hypothetical protein